MNNNQKILPIFFIFLTISWPLQVIFKLEAIGAVPYVFLLAGLFLTRINKKPNKLGIDILDASLFIAWIIILIHSFVYVTVHEQSLLYQVKWHTILIGSGLVYLYTSRSITQNGVRNVLWITIGLTTLIAAHWLFETYLKVIFHEILSYQLKAAEYAAFRNKVSIDQINTANIGLDYRAYGLFDRYTTTAAFIVIGAVSTLWVTYHSKIEIKISVFLFYLFVLFIGMATTALLLFAIIMPIAIALSNKNNSFIKSSLKISAYTCIFITSIYFCSFLDNDIGTLIKSRVEILNIQQKIAMNFSGSNIKVTAGKITTSFPAIYKNETNDYFKRINANPSRFLIGEGVGSGNRNRSNIEHMRGGDVGLFEFIHTFGIPITIFLLYSITYSLVNIKNHHTKNRDSSRNILLAGFIVIFLLGTLIHYGTFFKKEMLAYFMFALGLIRSRGLTLIKSQDK